MISYSFFQSHAVHQVIHFLVKSIARTCTQKPKTWDLQIWKILILQFFFLDIYHHTYSCWLPISLVGCFPGNFTKLFLLLSSAVIILFFLLLLSIFSVWVILCFHCFWALVAKHQCNTIFPASSSMSNNSLLPAKYV